MWPIPLFPTAARSCIPINASFGFSAAGTLGRPELGILLLAAAWMAALIRVAEVWLARRDLLPR